MKLDKLEPLCYPDFGLTVLLRVESAYQAYKEVVLAENKTTPNDQDVEQFLNSVDDERKRKDSFMILELMKQVTGLEPRMWGSSIVGFGSYHYKYESGREGDMILAGFSPRKQNLTLYNMGGF